MVTKSLDRVVKVVIAKMKRTYSLDNSLWTNFWEEIQSEQRNRLQKQFDYDDEIGLIYTAFNDSNWTLLTSHHLIGKFSGADRKVKIDKIENFEFGLVKGKDGVLKKLIIPTNNSSQRFIYETNGAGFMLKVGPDFIYTHWKQSAIE